MNAFMSILLLTAEPAIVSELDEAADKLMHSSPQRLLEELRDSAVHFLPRLLSALILLVVAHVIIRVVLSAAKAMLKRGHIDVTLHSFILSIIKYFLWILVGIMTLFILEIPASPFVAVLGSIGFALSLALKDSLANVAGGISVLFNHPFAKGDIIEVNGIIGTVKAIDLVYTRIVTDDDKIIYVPNGDLSKSVVINYSAEPLKRLDFVMFIPIEADFEQAKQIILGIINSDAYTLHKPEPIIAINGKKEDKHSVSCRVWAKAEHFDEIANTLYAEIECRLREAGM